MECSHSPGSASPRERREPRSKLRSMQRPSRSNSWCARPFVGAEQRARSADPMVGRTARTALASAHARTPATASTREPQPPDRANRTRSARALVPVRGGSPCAPGCRRSGALDRRGRRAGGVTRAIASSRDRVCTTWREARRVRKPRAGRAPTEARAAFAREARSRTPQRPRDTQAAARARRLARPAGLVSAAASRAVACAPRSAPPRARGPSRRAPDPPCADARPETAAAGRTRVAAGSPRPPRGRACAPR